MKRKSMKAEIAALTEEVRRLREEVAALRMFPPVQFVPYVPVTYPVFPGTPWPSYPLPYIGDLPGPPTVTITCEAAS